MAQIVCLNEKDHAVDLLHNLQGMQLEEDLCDFTIVVKNDTIRAHKCILSAGSQYFKAMLKYDTKESQAGKVEMKEVDVECVRSCIKFIYSGKFDIPTGKMAEFLHVAVMMQLQKIKEAVCDILKKSLNFDNYFSTREIATVYQLKSVLTNCMTFYCENFLMMSSKAEFICEPKSYLIKIFKSKNLISSEKDKLQSILRWSQEDVDKKEDLLDLVKLINLKEVSPDFLKSLLENDPIVSADFNLYKLINAQLIAALSNTTKESEEVEESLVLFNKSMYLQTYNLATDEMSELPYSSFSTQRNFTAVCLESYIYILCPGKSTYRLKFNEKLSNWERIPDSKYDHGLLPPCVSHSGSIFVIGAGSGIDPCKDVEQFCNEWLVLKSRPTVIAGAALVAVGDSIYSIGGWKTKSCNQSTSFCKFTPTTSGWANLPQLRYARSYCTVIAKDGNIYVAGGFRKSSPSTLMECFNVTSQQWTTLSSMPRQNASFIGCLINQSIHMMVRHEKSDEILKYDITRDNWSVMKMKNAYDVFDLVVLPN